MIPVARGRAVVGPHAIRLRTGLERDIEVLGPQVRVRRIVAGGQSGLDLAQGLSGERVEVRQTVCSGAVEAERRIVVRQAIGQQPRP